VRAAEQVFVGLPGPELDRDVERLLRAHPPGGFVLFKRNLVTVEQVGQLVAALRRAAPRALLAVDAEGGRVDRLRDLVAPAPGASQLAALRPGVAYEAGFWIAQALARLGFDLDFAPVVDLDRSQHDNALDGRCLGATPEAVAARARAVLAGLHAGGIGGCLKHFPGLGGAGEDTHFGMSRIDLGSDELAADLAPFEDLADFAGAVMVSHAVYPAWDPDLRPATLSPPIVELLRRRLRFTGVAFADDLEMKALDSWGDLVERAVASFAAGCDVLPVCSSPAALPEIAERLAAPELAPRLASANRRLTGLRRRLARLRKAAGPAVDLSTTARAMTALA
jgi:beta-N-acetylhexosaminidase